MKNDYTLEEMIKNIYFLVFTKLFFKKARLIRKPFIIRGKSLLEYKMGLTTGYNCRIEIFGKKKEGKKLIIGENCRMGDNVHIAASKKVTIGDNCLIASKVYISDTSHGEYNLKEKSSSPDIPPNDRPLYSKEVIIGKNVWIGENVFILPGVTVGNGVIIGANSVVTKDIAENIIAVGNPASPIKRWNINKGKWEKI